MNKVIKIYESTGKDSVSKYPIELIGKRLEALDSIEKSVIRKEISKQKK